MKLLRIWIYFCNFAAESSKKLTYILTQKTNKKGENDGKRFF